MRVVRHERALRQHPLDGRVPAVAYHDLVTVVDDRAREAVAAGGLGQRTGDVDKRHGRCSLEDTLSVRGYLRADLPQQRLLKLLLLLLRVQHLVLMLLQLRRRVAFATDQRLLALVVLRDRAHVCFRDLDVVTEDAVVAEFERFDAAAVALPALELGQVLPGVAGRRPQRVQLLREARPDDLPLRGRIVRDRRRD